MSKSADNLSISFNMITFGQPDAAIRALTSVVESDFYREGDEFIVLDTGSAPRDLQKLNKAINKIPGAKLIKAPELRIDYRPYILKWLGQDVLQKYRKKMKTTKGVRSFAEARELARKASKNPLLFWIDSDDVFVEEKPGMLRDMVEKCFGPKRESNQPEVDQILLDYRYNFAPDGACTTILRRERVVPRETFWWAGVCHEVLIPQPGVGRNHAAFFGDLPAYIVHTDARKEHFLSDVRNYILLKRSLEEETRTTGKFDPRTLYYLGNSARGMRRFDEAIELYKKFNLHSGSVDDRFAAMFYIAGIYLDPKVSRPHDALEYYFECIKIKPHDPRGYAGIQRAYHVLQRPLEGLKWYEISLMHKMPPDQVMSYDPTFVEYHPHVLAAFAYKELGKTTEALKCAEIAHGVRPELEEAQKLLQQFQNIEAGNQLARAVDIVSNHSNIGASNIVNSLAAVPEELEKIGAGMREQQEGRADRPEIAFFCPGSLEPWGPGNRKTGTGGSEKMVIILSEALQRTGRVNVTVYADVPHEQRGINADTGVAWFHWSQFDHTRPRYAMVYWRNLEAALSVPAISKYSIGWCHDVQDPARYNPALLSKLDFVQVQSAFHAAPIRDIVGNDKLWIARNAVEIPTDRMVERDSKQVIYCSSPDRGLLTAARIVQAARKIDPEISLVVTYGVTPWARKAFAESQHRWVPDVNHQMSMDLYERILFQVLDQVEATVLNRVNFEAMELLLQTSGVWLYPTRFPEISCMSAMEAQANGCAALATRYGALATTLLPQANLLSTHVPALPDTQELPEGYVEAVGKQLVETCQVPADDPRRLEQAAAAIRAFNVDDLAQEWLDKIGLGEGPSSAAGSREPLVTAAQSGS